MPVSRILLQPEMVYHIWTHASGSENLFRSEENYHYFLQKYTQYIYPIAETYAYCLMPNHLHLMVKFRDANALKTLQGFETLEGLELSKKLSKQFSNLFNGYTKAYNKMYSRRGSLFIPRFKRKQIDTEDYFTSLIAYIHNNPVNHGFVKELSDWPYSSWNSYLSERSSRLARDVGLSWFGGLDEFIDFHLKTKDKDVIILFEE